jgi:hypothetical protein
MPGTFESALLGVFWTVTTYNQYRTKTSPKLFSHGDAVLFRDCRGNTAFLPSFHALVALAD